MGAACVCLTLLLRQPDGGKAKQSPDEAVTLAMSLTLEPPFAHLSVREDHDTFLLELLGIGPAHTWVSPGAGFSHAAHLPLSPPSSLDPPWALPSEGSSGKMLHR